MKTFTTEETIDSKLAFDRTLQQYDVNVKSYRADNGRFHDEAFIQKINRSLQTISFCGVGANHQNSVAESNIRRIVATSRNQLLHAKRHWPEAINTILWSLALKEAVVLHNNFQFDSDGRNPISKLVGTKCLPNTKLFHTWAVQSTS